MLAQFRNRSPLTIFYSIACLYVIGGAIGSIALPWLLLKTLGDSGPITIIFSVQSSATIIAATIGSLIIDRFDRRVLSVVSNIIVAVALLIILGMSIVNIFSIVMLTVCTSLSAIFGSLSHGAESAMVPQLAALVGVKSHRINGTIGTINSVGDVLGPAVGALIVTLIGASWSFGVNFFRLLWLGHFSCFYRNLHCMSNKQMKIRNY